MRAWEKNVRTVIPYVPGEQPNLPEMIKLNTNENPYPPAPGVRRALERFDADSLRLYPDPAASDLTGILAKRYGLEKNQVFVGVGSDDVLAMAFLTFFNSGKPILFPDITYSFYDVWAELFRIPYECQPLDENFRIVRENYKKYNGGVVFPNPNAPTGIALDMEDVEYIISQNQDVVVIVDEAYIDFGGTSVVSLINKYDNLLVVQTFSKSRSMAGMRIGYAMGNKTLIKYLNDVKYSFNSYTMDRTALLLGVEAVKDEAYFAETVGKIINTREWTKEQLRRLGFNFEDSSSNFFFVTHGKYLARDLFEALKQKRIYVRYFNKPRIDNYLRITIGTDEEMQALVDFLKSYIEADTAGQ